MMIDINGGVIATAVSTFITVGGLLVWFGLNVLGKISALSTTVGEMKETMASIKDDQKESELRLDVKLDRWGLRLGEAEIHIAVLKAISSGNNDSNS